MKLKISKNDEVLVIAGKDKGRKGMVLQLDATKRKVRVKDVAMKTHFDKKDGIKQQEGFIDYSNVKLVKKADKAKKKKAKK